MPWRSKPRCTSYDLFKLTSQFGVKVCSVIGYDNCWNSCVRKHTKERFTGFLRGDLFHWYCIYPTGKLVYNTQNKMKSSGTCTYWTQYISVHDFKWTIRSDNRFNRYAIPNSSSNLHLTCVTFLTIFLNMTLHLWPVECVSNSLRCFLCSQMSCPNTVVS